MKGSNSTADEWIQLALCEYEQIASLSNVQSLLGNAVASAPPSLPSQMHDGSASASQTKNIYDPKMLSEQMQQRNVDDLLVSYVERIDDVRKTHASLKSKATSIAANNNLVHDTHTISRPSSMEVAFTTHIDLSERVINTIMRAPSPGSNGPCGLFYENGLIRTANAQDHENNIVALAALRASVSRLKRDFGSDRL